MSAFDPTTAVSPQRSGERSGFHLGRANKKMMGVCSGMADYTGVDVTLIRVGWAIATLLGVGSLILVYLAIGLIAD